MQAPSRKMSNQGENKKSRVCHLDKTRLFHLIFITQYSLDQVYLCICSAPYCASSASEVSLKRTGLLQLSFTLSPF